MRDASEWAHDALAFWLPRWVRQAAEERATLGLAAAMRKEQS